MERNCVPCTDDVVDGSPDDVDAVGEGGHGWQVQVERAATGSCSFAPVGRHTQWQQCTATTNIINSVNNTPPSNYGISPPGIRYQSSRYQIGNHTYTIICDKTLNKFPASELHNVLKRKKKPSLTNCLWTVVSGISGWMLKQETNPHDPPCFKKFKQDYRQFGEEKKSELSEMFAQK